MNKILLLVTMLVLANTYQHELVYFVSCFEDRCASINKLCNSDATCKNVLTNAYNSIYFFIQNVKNMKSLIV